MGEMLEIGPSDTARCRSCEAEIVWTFTGTGKRMPLDVVPVPADTRGPLFALRARPQGGYLAFAASSAMVEDTVLYRSHFATCPHADEHRRG